MRLLYFCKGRVKYRVKSENPETAVNKLRHGVAVSDISISDGTLSFSCFYAERKKTDKIVHELSCEILSVRFYGIPHMLSKYRKRVGLFAGALFMTVCIFVSTFFVWDISVEGNETVSDAEIIRELERAGFSIGMMKKRADIETCVNMLLVNEDRLSWAAINFEGTLAHVEVKEAKIGKREEVKENVNLVASHNGIIIRADALDGKAMVEKGDAVIKGQLLVSAFMDKRTGGSLLTGARGYVWANTERCYSVVVPFKHFEKKYTGKKGVKYSFSILGKSINLPYIGEHRFKNSDETVKETAVSLGENFRLPLRMGIVKKSEYECIDKRRTEAQALEIAKETANMRLFKDSPDFVLAEITEKYICDENALIYTCIFEGVENIASELEFEFS